MYHYVTKDYTLTFKLKNVPSGQGVVITGMLADVSDNFKKSGVLTIPSKIDNLWVHSVANMAFKAHPLIKKVIIENGAFFIGDSAFRACRSLHSVEFPKSLRWIGNYAFDNCKNLKHAAFSEGLKTIDSFAFSGTNIKELLLPDTLKNINEGAFYEADIVDVSLGPNVKIIGEKAFAKTSIKNVKFSEGLNVIADFAFSDSNVTSVILPDSLTSLGHGVFSFYEKLETIHIGKNTHNYFGENDFAYGCCRLKNIIVSPFNTSLNTLIRIPSNTDLEKVCIPNWVNTFANASIGDVSLKCLAIKSPIINNISKAGLSYVGTNIDYN